MVGGGGTEDDEVAETEDPSLLDDTADEAGDRPVRIRNGDFNVSGSGWATTGYRDTAGDLPVCENANPANPGA